MSGADCGRLAWADSGAAMSGADCCLAGKGQISIGAIYMEGTVA